MTLRTLAVLGCLALVAPTLCGADDLRVSHLYELSDFTGTVPYSDVILHADRHHDEVYAVAGSDVRVFNSSGMEIYGYRHDNHESKIVDLEVDEAGNIITLNFAPSAIGGIRAWWINRSNYRGELTGRVEVSGLPSEIQSFIPSRLFVRDGRFMLVSTGQSQVVVVDESGAFQKHHDLTALLGIDDPDTTMISGFSIDRAGNMLLTVPTQFRAYVISPDETVRPFGSAGSAPGKFGVVAGIAGTDDGHYLVADKLRGVVMVFDSSFSLVTEFAGNSRWALARPTVLELGNSGRLYVSQSRKRGVAVLGLSSTSDDRAIENGTSKSISENRSLREHG